MPREAKGKARCEAWAHHGCAAHGTAARCSPFARRGHRVGQSMMHDASSPSPPSTRLAGRGGPRLLGVVDVSLDNTRAVAAHPELPADACGYCQASPARWATVSNSSSARAVRFDASIRVSSRQHAREDVASIKLLCRRAGQAPHDAT
jgi:hypothetical protein